MSALLFGTAVAMFVVGLVSVPLLVYGLDFVLRDSLPHIYREPMGRIMFTLGQIANGATALIPDGYQWRLERMQQEEDHWRLESGNLIQSDKVVRFGMRPFAVVASEDNIPDRYQRDVDGQLGRFVDPVSGQRLLEYRPWDEGPLIDLSAVTQRISDLNRAGLARDGFLEAMEESGGKNNIGPIAYVVLMFALVLTGSLTGLLAMGVIP